MSSPPRKQAPKRSPFAVPLLLGLLEAGPQHGYALFKTIQGDLRGVCQIGMNRLYALLEEMEAQGLVRGHRSASLSGPARKIYATTAKGRRALQAWLTSPSPTMREMRVDFPPKLFLAQRRSASVVAELIAAQREACQHELERMATEQGKTGGEFMRLIYGFRVGQIKAGIAWLDQCKRQLEPAREAA